jgi:hypothetical protein
MREGTSGPGPVRYERNIGRCCVRAGAPALRVSDSAVRGRGRPRSGLVEGLADELYGKGGSLTGRE